jgi:hypothetical protein
MIAAREPTATRVKDRCMVNALDFAQQGARTTGAKMRNNESTAMSKGAISYMPRISYSIKRPFPDTFIISGIIIFSCNSIQKTAIFAKKIKRIFLIQFLPEIKLIIIMKFFLKFKLILLTNIINTFKNIYHKTAL